MSYTKQSQDSGDPLISQVHHVDVIGQTKSIDANHDTQTQFDTSSNFSTTFIPSTFEDSTELSTYHELKSTVPVAESSVLEVSSRKSDEEIERNQYETYRVINTEFGNPSTLNNYYSNIQSNFEKSSYCEPSDASCSRYEMLNTLTSENNDSINHQTNTNGEW